MSRSLLPDPLAHYVCDVVTQESSVLKRLRAETAQLPGAGMQVSSDVGALLAFLVRTIGAARAIEVGTFTGYSALAVATALPAGGKLVCCDVSEQWTGIARRYWAEAGVADRIELRLAPASETLAALLADDGNGRFDFAFIDADKEGYDAYYESCLKLVRAGGLIAFDNMLWGGAVADEAATDADTKALAALNAKLARDARVDFCLLSVGDGIALARRR